MSYRIQNICGFWQQHAPCSTYVRTCASQFYYVQHAFYCLLILSSNTVEVAIIDITLLGFAASCPLAGGPSV